MYNNHNESKMSNNSIYYMLMFNDFLFIGKTNPVVLRKTGKG